MDFNESDKPANAHNTPIWYSPAWITAIVGLVSAFLTVPQVVSDWLVTQQQLELANIERQDAIRENEFKPMNTVLTLESGGRRPVQDRETVLRFIVQTSSNEGIKKWAEEELRIRFGKER